MSGEEKCPGKMSYEDTSTGAGLSESDSEHAACLGYTKNAAAFEISHLSLYMQLQQ